MTIATVIIIIYFTNLGISIATTAFVVGIIYIPWMLKFIAGPITDYFTKYGRKPFILMGGLISALCLFPLAVIDPLGALLPFTALLFLSHIFVVFLDVSADAWAIQLSQVHERGKINAAMTIGLFGGMAVSSSVLSIIANSFGFSMVFIAAGGLILLTILFPLAVQEKKMVKQRQKIISLLIWEFKKKNTILVALFGFFGAMNFGMLIIIVPEYMMNFLHLDVVQTGLISTLFPIGNVGGAIVGGIIGDTWGRKKTLSFFLSWLVLFSSLLTLAHTWQILAILYGLIGFTIGAASYAVLMALLMDVTNPKIGATQYSILTSISNFGDIGIGMISGTLVLMLGYDRFFLYAAWIVGPALLLLYFVKEKQKEQWFDKYERERSKIKKKK